MALLTMQWTSTQQMALLVGGTLYVLLVIACHRIASAERRWRAEERQIAADNLRAMVDVERKIKLQQRLLESASHAGHTMDAQIKILELEQTLRVLHAKEARYGNAKAEED